MIENNFKIIDDNNKEIECHLLHKFSNNNNNYIIYTDHTYNENGELNIMAFKYKIESETIIPIEITEENEWNLIEEEWSKVNE